MASTKSSSEIINKNGPSTRCPAEIRKLFNEFVRIFLVVVFMKMFLVDIYKIPSASMTPTLIGGMVALVDVNGDDRRDIIFLDQQQQVPFVFIKSASRYIYNKTINPDTMQLSRWDQQGILTSQHDRILVNKLAYWFQNPSHGDITIFKVPGRLYRPQAPIYIKRCTGTPGDLLTFDSAGHLKVNGRKIVNPGFFRTQQYVDHVNSNNRGFFQRPEIEYDDIDNISLRLRSIRVPNDEYYVFGDNMHGSLDSRYWGGVPRHHIKGRAFMRVWPPGQINFLR